MRPPLHPAWVWLPPCALLAALLLTGASGSDRALFLLLNRAGGAVDGTIWLHLSMPGEAAIALAFVLPCIRRAPRCFWAGLVALAIAGLWAGVASRFIELARPLAVFDAGAFFHAGPAGQRAAFPSGHAALACALAGVGVMGLAGRNAVRALLLLLAGLAGLARIMAGAAWPVDVLCGWLGGWLGAWAGLALAGRWRWRWSGRRDRNTSGRAGMPAAPLIAGLLLAGLAAGLLLGPHAGSPAVMPVRRLVGGACLAWGLWEMAAMLPRFGGWRLHRWRPGRWRRAGPGAKGGVIKGRATDG